MPSLFQRVRERLRAFVNRDARQPVSRAASARLPTEFGEFDIHVYESPRDARGTRARRPRRRARRAVPGPLVVRHRRYLPFGALRLRAAAPGGAGADRQRGPGRAHLPQSGRPGYRAGRQIRAYKLQEQGADTVEANERLGFPADLRDYRAALEMLRDLGVSSVRLMSNNPKKLEGLAGDGLAVNERLPIEIAATAASQHYLRTRRTSSDICCHPSNPTVHLRGHSMCALIRRTRARRGGHSSGWQAPLT